MCKSCEALSINGVNCHETGCPDAWMDKVYECKECGCEFRPEQKGQIFCSEHCSAMYRGFACGCESCQELYEETDYSGNDNDGFLLEETEEDIREDDEDQCLDCLKSYSDCTCEEDAWFEKLEEQRESWQKSVK